MSCLQDLCEIGDEMYLFGGATCVLEGSAMNSKALENVCQITSSAVSVWKRCREKKNSNSVTFTLFIMVQNICSQPRLLLLSQSERLLGEPLHCLQRYRQIRHTKIMYGKHEVSVSNLIYPSSLANRGPHLALALPEKRAGQMRPSRHDDSL